MHAFGLVGVCMVVVVARAALDALLAVPAAPETHEVKLVSSAQVSLQAERRDIRRVISCVSPPIHIQHNKVCR